MSAPPNRPPGQRPQDSTDEEARRREQAIQLAMLDDLGIARVEQLPLENEHWDRDRGHRGYNAGFNHRPPPPRPQPRGNMTGEAWSLSQAWGDAIKSGFFNDDDAESVKGLTDLGGRLYDNRSTGFSQVNRVMNKTMRILGERDKRVNQQAAAPVAPNKRPRLDVNHSTFQRMIPQAHALPPRPFVPAVPSAPSVKSTVKTTKPKGPNPLSRPARVRLPPTASSSRVPIPHMVLDPNAPLPIDLANVVFRTTAEFLSRDVNPAVKAIVLLSAASPPDLGHFTVLVYGRKYCDWKASQFSDYATGSGNVVWITFNDPNSITTIGYELEFNNYEDLRTFMTTIQSLKDGNHPSQAALASTPAPAPTSVPQSTPVVFATPAVAPAQSIPAPPTASPRGVTPRVVRPPMEPAQPHVGAQDSVPSQAPSVIETVPAPAAQSVDRPSESMGGPSQEDFPVELRANSEQGTLIDLDRHEASTVASQPPSEAAALLSALDPYEYPRGVSNGITSTEQLRSVLSFTARIIFQLFIYGPTNDRTKTAKDLDEIAEGIRSGVLEHFMRDSRAQDLDDQSVQQVKDLIREMVDTEIEANRAREQAAAESGRIQYRIKASRAREQAPTEGGRIQYSIEEMLALRHAAIEPPNRLADIPHLPRPGDRPRQISSMSRSPAAFSYRKAPSDMDSPKPTFAKPQVMKAASAMQWAMEQTDSPEPETEALKQALDEISRQEESEQGRTTSSGAAGPSRTRDQGLQSSRWASGVSTIMHANNFTGPAYEKIWAKRSYLEDLAQLDLETRGAAGATFGAEDLMDFYFPMPTEDTRAGRDGQASTTTGDEPGVDTPSRTDEIENLRVGISRLSIWSPPSASSRPVAQTTLAQPPSSVMQTSSALLAQIGSAPSTQPSMPPVRQAVIPSEPITSPIPAHAAEPIQSPPAMPAQPSIPQETQPRLRGLAASRHSAGAGPAKSGNFNFYVPPSDRK